MFIRPSVRYHAELTEFRVTYSKAGCLTSIVLVLGGVGLDAALYPDRLQEFFIYRLAVAIFTAAIFSLLFTAPGRRYVRVLTMLWLALPQIMIGLMIMVSDGAN